MALSPFVAGYDQLIVDLDGCVWLGDEPIPGAAEALGELRSTGRRMVFVTNEPRKTIEELVRKLWKAGVQAAAADVVTVGSATQHLLAETRQGRTAFVIGTPSLRRHVSDAGLRVVNGTSRAAHADVVVVAGTDDLVYADLRDAQLSLFRGAEFIATGRDSTYPQPDGPWPGTGAILAAVEYSSGRRATIVGKPEPELFHTALDRLGAGRTLVVGDRLDSDIAAAAAAGLDAALVLTGGTSRAEADAAMDGAPTGPRPLVVADSLAALVSGPTAVPPSA